jgi:hypothetical protein
MPLSKGAGAVVVRALVGEWADDELCLACHDATGGNPFLLHELAGELAHRGRNATAGEVSDLKPGTVTRTVLLRLARLPVGARRLAVALRVLGHGATLSEGAELCGLERTEAARLADLLIGSDILRPGTSLDFVHPLVADVTYNESAPVQRGQLHDAAAHMYSRAGLDVPVLVRRVLRRHRSGVDRGAAPRLGAGVCLGLLLPFAVELPAGARFRCHRRCPPVPGQRLV